MGKEKERAEEMAVDAKCETEAVPDGQAKSGKKEASSTSAKKESRRKASSKKPVAKEEPASKQDSSAKKEAAAAEKKARRDEATAAKAANANKKHGCLEEPVSKKRRAKEGLVTLAHKAAAVADPNLLDTGEGATDVPDDLKGDSQELQKPAILDEEDDDAATETDLETMDDIEVAEAENAKMTIRQIKQAVEAKVSGLKNSMDDKIDEDDIALDEDADEDDPDKLVAYLLDHLEEGAKAKLLADADAVQLLRSFVSLQQSSRYAVVTAMQAHLDDLHTQAAGGLVVRLSQYERDSVVYRERNRFAAASGFAPLVIDDVGMEMAFNEPTDVYHTPMVKLRKQLAEGSQAQQFVKSKDRARARRHVVVWVAASAPHICIAPLIKTGKDDALMPSSTVKTVPISQVVEVRLGQKTQPFERRTQSQKYEHESYVHSFSLILMSGKTLDFVMSSNIEFQLWVHGLTRLILSVQLEGPSFVPLQRAWRRAKKSAAITFGELSSVLHAMNIHKNQAKVLLKQYGFEKSQMYPFSLFTEKLVDKVFRRPGIAKIFQKYASAAKMTAPEFRNFLLNQQHEDLGEGHVASLMRQIAGDESFSVQHFETYLESRHNTAWDPSCSNEVYHDMKQPLVNYYLNSSHNTYCAEDQLLGVSSNDMYRQVLLQGCRCVELDTWDGSNGEPVIYHGHTMTTKILVEDVCRTVMSYAFVVSPFPVVLSVENHCGTEQQERMAAIFEEVFGSALSRFPPESVSPYACPSPEELRYKILVKGRFNCKAMSDLVFMHSTPITKSKELVETDALTHPCVSSLTEGAIGNSSVEKMRKVSKDVFIRTYPAGDRFNSTNYDPDHAWSCGCQMVALNMQTSDIHTWRNAAKFADNGGCGLLLKPTAMWSRAAIDQGRAPYTLEITILSARNLPRRTSHGDHVASPYVKLLVTGDKKDRFEKKTKMVKSCGLNPEWNKSFTMQIRSPDLALLTFVVCDGHAASGSAGLKPTKKGTGAAGATVATGGVLAAGAVVATGGLALPLVLGGAAAGAIGAAVVGYSVANKSRNAKLAYASVPLNCLRSGYRILPLSDKKKSVDTLCDLLIHTKLTCGERNA